MTENRFGEFEYELAAAYRDATENAEDLAEGWDETSSEAWDTLHGTIQKQT